nr:MAG TPA: transposon-encoded protein [Caudoviricetes sp.]
MKKNQVTLYNNIWQPETRGIYANIIIRGILQEQLEETFFHLVKQLTEKDSINERLKAEDQML